MAGDVTSSGNVSQTALLMLFRNIVAGDQAAALQQLAQSPSLAQLALITGAARENASVYFFTEISHYTYAGDTALHMAAAAHQVAIVTQLISNGAHVSAQNRRGATPLHYAADGAPGSTYWDPTAQYVIVEQLIRAGADPNAEDKSGVAPIHRAARTRCTGAVRALLDHGVDVRIQNKQGSTPLHLAIQTTGRSGSGSKESRAEQAAIIRLLQDHGAHPSDKDANGKAVIDAVKSDAIRALLTW